MLLLGLRPANRDASGGVDFCSSLARAGELEHFAPLRASQGLVDLVLDWAALLGNACGLGPLPDGASQDLGAKCGAGNSYRVGRKVKAKASSWGKRNGEGGHGVGLRSTIEGAPNSMITYARPVVNGVG